MSLNWAELRGFIIRRKAQIPYVHLKSSLNGETQLDLLAQGDVPLAEFFPLVAENAWLCVELPMSEVLSSCMRRVADGLAMVKSMTWR
jgi:hypothetical protein